MLKFIKRFETYSSKAVVLLMVLYLFSALSCGKRKPPLPPIERVPQKVSIQAFQRGNQVILSWRMPARNASDSSVLNIDRIDIYRLAEPSANSLSLTEQDFINRSTLISTLKTDSDDFGLKEISFFDTLEFAGQPIRLVYAVRLVNASGQKASFSNFVVVESTARVARSPLNPSIRVTEPAVELSWDSPISNIDGGTPVNIVGYNIYRSESEDGTYMRLNKTPVTANSFADTSFDFGRQYFYFIRTVSLGADAESLESVDSEKVNAEPLDNFAPNPPSSITIAASPNTISIFFAANIEKDIAGYRVFRSNDRDKPVSDWTSLTPELIKTNTFTDTNVESGETYYYFLTATDRAGNVSRASEVVFETVP